MKKILFIAILLGQVVLCPQLLAQENESEDGKEDTLQQKKEQIITKLVNFS